ncbi:hypothetical protein EG349_10355 [Chryseobacterium shandongense]|uniref:Uncharacterized protein n=2 Tax=Chryseobacterium TaxID=59732 RepID=A0AAD0YA68_9FLAO|nr:MULTISPECIES: hypothetical protein [Chryseobacterium]AZA87161.1 hypothetical protein EG349_10355 [Chryseobacterium shandongense]AZA95590.1 hypothetical protein EG353_08430 [Chryseobacterium shandongense]MEC3876130.1 hypothetical protein [Chryseobacterium sp. T9W2-O]
MSAEIDEFVNLSGRKNKKQQTLILQWAKVTAVDWENKTCDAKGVDDDLEFYDILIGAGCFDQKPKIGALIIIGMINNTETTPVLLSAEEIDRLEIKAGNCELTIDDGFLIKKENETLKKLMSDFIQACRNMVFKTNSGITIELLTDPEFQLLQNRFNNFLK